MARGNRASRAAGIVEIACDDHGKGGCQRTILEVKVNSSGDVLVLGELVPQNGDPGGTQTARVPAMRLMRRRRTAEVRDTTDPAERERPQFRMDLLQQRWLAHENGRLGPDGLSFDEGVAKDVAAFDQLLRKWDPAGTTSGTGARMTACSCRGRRYVFLTQDQLNRAYHTAVARKQWRITLDDLRHTRLT
jgi:hypothetical protein